MVDIKKYILLDEPKNQRLLIIHIIANIHKRNQNKIAKLNVSENCNKELCNEI